MYSYAPMPFSKVQARPYKIFWLLEKHNNWSLTTEMSILIGCMLHNKANFRQFTGMVAYISFSRPDWAAEVNNRTHVLCYRRFGIWSEVVCLGDWGLGVRDSDNSIYSTRVQMLDQQAHEADLFASIVEHHLWVIGLAAEAVWCHHHGQIVGIHLCNSSSLRQGKLLQKHLHNIRHLPLHKEHCSTIIHWDIISTLMKSKSTFDSLSCHSSVELLSPTFMFE